MAASHGFEPRLTESESAVLPLDDEAIINLWQHYKENKVTCQAFLAEIKKFFLLPLKQKYEKIINVDNQY